MAEYYADIGRPDDFKPLAPADGAYYDRMVTIHLDRLESMIALPFHPSKAYTIHELQADPEAPLSKKADENSAVAWFPAGEAVEASSEPWFRERIYPKLNEKMARFFKNRA